MIHDAPDPEPKEIPSFRMFSCVFQMFQQIWFFIGLKTVEGQNGWNVPSLKFQCNMFGMEAEWTNKTNSSKASF